MRFFIPAALWLIICTVLFTLPGSAFPKKRWIDIPHFDKLVHIGLIGLLVFLTAWGYFRYRHTLSRTSLLWMVAAAAAYGIIIEFIQLHFIINRGFDTGDIIADIIGAIGGAVVLRWFLKRSGRLL